MQRDRVVYHRRDTLFLKVLLDTVAVGTYDAKRILVEYMRRLRQTSGHEESRVIAECLIVVSSSPIAGSGVLIEVR